MRQLAQKLGVKAMSLYNHVANKEDILAGLVDLVVGEIALPYPRLTGKLLCGNGRSRRIPCCCVILGRRWRSYRG
ncbi:MAG: TetR/AcrR family transcriptional regulator [Leptolyngbyaceae cyanobacterium]